jgi:hypothetical protein
MKDIRPTLADFPALQHPRRGSRIVWRFDFFFPFGRPAPLGLVEVFEDFELFPPETIKPRSLLIVPFTTHSASAMRCIVQLRSPSRRKFGALSADD